MVSREMTATSKDLSHEPEQSFKVVTKLDYPEHSTQIESTYNSNKFKEQKIKSEPMIQAKERFERIVTKDNQQNVRISQRYESGGRYVPNGTSFVTPVMRQACCGFLNNRMRYLVIGLSLIGVMLCSMARGVFNVSIPLMTNDNNNNNTKTDLFNWTKVEQDQLLGAFFYFYSPFQIPTGILAEKYGSKYILVSAVAISGLVSLLTPLMANMGEHAVPILMVSRMFVGAVQAGLLPALYALINRWITATEAIVIASILKTAFRVGAMEGSGLPGLVDRWEMGFYITGSMCIIWTLIWLFLFTSKPQDNSFISIEELYRIARKKRNRSSILASIESGIEMNIAGCENPPEGTPRRVRKNKDQSSKVKKPIRQRTWFIILTSPSVIGLVLCKLATNMVTDFLTGILSTFIKDLYRGDKTQITSLTALLNLVQVVVSFPITWAVQYIGLKKPLGITTTNSRKLFQGISCFGSAIGLAILPLCGLNIKYAASVLVFISIVSMCACGGEALVPYDLSDKYPATIMAMANSFSSTSGFLVPILSTTLVSSEDAHDLEMWSQFLYTIAGINVIGGLIFMIMVKAEKIKFTTTLDTSDDHSPETTGPQTQSADVLPPFDAAAIHSDKSNIEKTIEQDQQQDPGPQLSLKENGENNESPVGNTKL